jgi:hypothetical protein
MPPMPSASSPSITVKSGNTGLVQPRPSRYDFEKSMGETRAYFKLDQPSPLAAETVGGTSGVQRMIRGLFFVLAIVAFSTPASARNITSEVQYFRDVSMLISENADVCGFKDPEPYIEHVKKGLSALDVPYNPDALTEAVILVTASAGGFLNRDCIVYIQLRLQATMDASFLNLNSYEGEDTVLHLLSKRNYAFPMVFYQTGTIFTEYNQSMQEKTLKILDQLLENLSRSRGER